MNKNIPNILCLIRVVMTPVIVVLMTADGRLDFTVRMCVSLGLFCVAMLTDLFDGKIARKYNLVSDMGKFLDPIADKMLILGTMIAFVQLKLFPALPVVLILAREFAVTGLRLIAAPKGAVIAASFAGKAKTMTQSVCMVAAFCVTIVAEMMYQSLLPFSSFSAYPNLYMNPFAGDWRSVTMTALIWIVAVVTLVSAIPYFKQGMKYLKD